MVIPTVLGAFALFWLGRTLGKRITARRSWLLAGAAAAALAVPGLLFAVYYTHLFDSAVWFYRFRSLPTTELTACGLGFGAGLAQARLVGGPAGLFGWPAILVLVVLIPFIKPILDPVRFDHERRSQDEGVVLQSTMSTCGPASAATILNALGHPASEGELAREAFTSRGGTENWYLARALRRRGLDVAFEIRAPNGGVVPVPSIAGVLLPGRAGHFIAILDSVGDSVTFVDPIDGKHTMATSALLERYRFTGFFMVVRRLSSSG